MTPRASDGSRGPGDGDFPTLSDLATWVARGELSLTQAHARIGQADVSTLTLRLAGERPGIPELFQESASDLPFRRAFLELATAAALRVDSALEYLNYSLNLGRLLCTEMGEIERGLGLLTSALQQVQVVELKPAEVMQVVLEVADVYLTHHKRMGLEYLEAAAEAYRLAIGLAEAGEPDGLLIARAHAGLGVCIAEQWEGERMVRSSEAIAHYETALQYLDEEKNAFLYGLVLHNLGNAYRHRAEGDRASNLRQAATCFERARVVRAREVDLSRFRLTCWTLAEVESEMKHPLRAIELLEQALETLSPIRQRAEYGDLQLRLAAHCLRADHLTGEGEKSLRALAMACYVVVREVSDPDREADRWAAATAGWAAAHQRSGRFEEALALREGLLGELSPARHARRLAVVALDQIQLLAFLAQRHAGQGELNEIQRLNDRARELVAPIQESDLGEHRKLLAKALIDRMDSLLTADAEELRARQRSECNLLAQALALYPPGTPRSEHESLENRLMGLLREIGATEELLPLVRRRLAGERDFLDHRPSLVDYYNYCAAMRGVWNMAVEALLEQGEVAAARWDADRARGRALDLIAHSTAARHASDADGAVESYVPSSYSTRHVELVAEWLANVDEHDVESGLRRDAVAPWLKQSMMEAASWRGQWMFNRRSFPDEACPEPVSFPDMPTAVIELWCSDRESCAFVQLPSKKNVEVVPLPGLEVSRQIEWISEWFTRYGDVEQRGQAAIPAFSRMMKRLSRELGEACWTPLREILEPARRLILIPDLHLSALPLHAMTIAGRTGESSRLCDRYEVAFSPSLRQLQRALGSTPSVRTTALFLGNPQAECPIGICPGSCRLSLPMAESELAALRESWPEVEVLQGKGCTPGEVLRRLAELRPWLLHVCAHGLTRFDDPLGSGFILAYDGVPNEDPLTLYVNHQLGTSWGSSVSGEVLTLDRLLREADLRECHLAFLNACEVGLNYIGTPGEPLGLAAGMLAAGVPTVIAPLWPITEAVAGLFAKRFYEELRRDRNHKLRAVMEAQRWLRSLTYDELVTLVSPEQLQAGILLSGREHPFSDMFFWGPFQLLGNPF